MLQKIDNLLILHCSIQLKPNCQKIGASLVVGTFLDAIIYETIQQVTRAGSSYSKTSSVAAMVMSVGISPHSFRIQIRAMDVGTGLVHIDSNQSVKRGNEMTRNKTQTGLFIGG